MEFEVQFETGSIIWLPWTEELFDTVPYETFCRNRPELYLLIFGAKEAADFVKRKDKEVIAAVKPGDTCYVDIRYYGAAWYNTLGLPDADHRKYVVQHKYTQWNNARQTEITADCQLFDERFQHKGYFVFAYGTIKTYDEKSMTKLDAKWTKRYPKLLPNDRGKISPQIQTSLPPVQVEETTHVHPLPAATKELLPADPPLVVHTRPPDSGTHPDTRRNAKRPSRFLNILLQEELVESDNSSDSY